jgi:hypothetical protein
MEEVTMTGWLGIIGGSITVLGGAIAVFWVRLTKAYRELRALQRGERAADAEQARKELEADANLWRRQYEEKCKSDERFNARIEDELRAVYIKYQQSEAHNVQCDKDRAAHERRIAELEKLLGKS